MKKHTQDDYYAVASALDLWMDLPTRKGLDSEAACVAAEASEGAFWDQLYDAYDVELGVMVTPIAIQLACEKAGL